MLETSAVRFLYFFLFFNLSLLYLFLFPAEPLNDTHMQNISNIT